MAGIKNGTLCGTNADFTQNTGPNSLSSESNGLISDGQLWIGSTATNVGGTHINVGNIIAGAGIIVGYSSPNITIALTGGSSAIERVTLQTGTSPIVPSGGTIIFNGAVVAAGTNPVRTDGTGANTMVLEVQTSQALAAADATKIGLSNFDSTSFAVAATGFVTLSTTGVGKTITGDSGGALSPTANNWNILGGPGVTTTGSGSTLTINSVVFTDQGGSTSVTSDSGSFATAAITLTLPATPAQGEVCQFVATTAAVLVVDAPGTQLIRIGNAISSAGGTASSSGLAGDSLVLRYRTADTTWYSVGGPQGVWVTA